MNHRNVFRVYPPDGLLDSLPKLVATSALSWTDAGEPFDRLVLFPTRRQQVEQGRDEDYLKHHGIAHKNTENTQVSLVNVFIARTGLVP